MGINTIAAGQVGNPANSDRFVLDPNGSLQADASSITGASIASQLSGSGTLTPTGLGTINMLREAVQLQRFLERDARGGTLYTETVWARVS